MAAPALAQSPPSAQEDPGDFEDIVVTGKRGGLRRQPDAVEFLQRFCFDPSRRMGKPAPPLGEPRWEELDEKTRAKFRLTDPSVPAFSFVDQGRRHLLLLKFERFSRPAQVVETRCTLVVIGGRDHARFQDRMSQLFKGPGAEKHVGRPEGTPFIPGWRQWVWTGMPRRGAKAWRALQRPRGEQGGSYLVVIDPDFYKEYDYIVGDLKTKQNAARSVSMLSFSHFSRPNGRAQENAFRSRAQ
jgi:hypothetical protein